MTDNEPESESDKKIFDSLFVINSRDLPGGKSEQIKLSDLKNIFYTHAQEIKEIVFNKLVENGYFKGDPRRARAPYYIFGAMLIFSMFYFANLFSGYIFFINIFITACIVVGFGYLMPARTEKGVRTREYILGLKEYLQIAEKDRINFHNAPEKKPEIFEKLLPYAMVLGVENAWAKEFNGIYTEPPRWYTNGHMGTFNTIYLASSLGDFYHTYDAATFSRPGSRGGGFSGGGGGGGGGGSW